MSFATYRVLPVGFQNEPRCPQALSATVDLSGKSCEAHLTEGLRLLAALCDTAARTPALCHILQVGLLSIVTVRGVSGRKRVQKRFMGVRPGSAAAAVTLHAI